MANHSSAKKHIRSDAAKQSRNKYQHKTTRTLIKRVLSSEDKHEAQKLYPRVSGLLDKLAKKSIIHKNKASNKKSQLARHINKLAK